MKNTLITSLQHPLVKYCVKLRKDRRFRREEQKALITGSILIQELFAKNVQIETLITLAGSPPNWNVKEVVETTQEVLDKITEQKESMAAIVKLPSFQNLSKTSYLLVLDQIADPGNLGTLLRTAHALGWEGVFLVEGSCDPFAEKALRAAKGSTFVLPLQEGSWEQFCAMAKGFTVLTADMAGAPLGKITASTPLALLLSKESRGARKEAKELFKTVSIPMQESAESLNVAVAGAILLYGLKRI